MNEAFPNSCRAAYISNPVLGYSDRFTLYFHVKNVSKRNIDKAEEFCGLLLELGDYNRLSEFGLEDIIFVHTADISSYRLEEKVNRGYAARIL